MAGYWPNSFLRFLWTEVKSRSIKCKKQKTKQKQNKTKQNKTKQNKNNKKTRPISGAILTKQS